MKLSPTGRVPFLVDGDFHLYESRIINDYLAEKWSWDRAYSKDVNLRAQQKLLMTQWDSLIVPAFYKSLRSGGEIAEKQQEEIKGALEWISKTIEQIDHEANNLAALHTATHWARAV